MVISITSHRAARTSSTESEDESAADGLGFDSIKSMLRAEKEIQGIFQKAKVY
jgi:hypothetical protein